MKTRIFVLGVFTLAALAGCKKESLSKTSDPVTAAASTNVSVDGESSAERIGPGDYIYGVTKYKFYTVRMTDGAHQNPADVIVFPHTIMSMSGIAKDYSGTNVFYITTGNDDPVYPNRFLSFTYSGSGTPPTSISAAPKANFPMAQSVKDIEFQPTTNTLYGISNGGYLVSISNYGGITAAFTNVGSSLSTIGADFASCTSLSFDETGKLFLVSNTGRIATITISGASYVVNSISAAHFTIPAGHTLIAAGSGIVKFYDTMGFGCTYVDAFMTPTTLFRFSNQDVSGNYSTSTAPAGPYAPCNDYTDGRCGSCPR